MITNERYFSLLISEIERGSLPRLKVAMECIRADYVKGKVVDDAENRKALYERLLFALQDYKDPWLERAEADRKSELGRELQTIAIREAMKA